MSNLPFVEEILADLRRFKECVEDGQDVDLGRDRFDLLTRLGLLERVQRSPARWMMTQAGEDAIAPPAAAPVVVGEPVATWVALTAAGQLRKGDKIRFRFGQETLTETVALVLEAGTEREEIVYNRKRNFYFITSKALAGTSSAKEVEVLRTVAAPPAAAHGNGFRAWLAAEMPAGTVICDPSWWAERILKRIGYAAHGDEAVRRDAERYRALREMTEGLDTTVDAMIAEAAAMRAQGDGEVQ